MAPTAAHRADPHENTLAGARAWLADNGLSRPREGQLLAGVCASFSRRYDVNPLLARLLAIAGILILTPLAYVVLWILMPREVADGEATPATTPATA